MPHEALGPCAKQRVVAVAVMKDDTVFVGENICVTPQSACPRAKGEAYVKCTTICGQLGHAEEVVLRQARMRGYRPHDIRTIDVYGHTGPCDHCRSLLDDLGLLQLTRFHPLAQYPALTPAQHEQIARAYNLYAPSSHSSAAVKS